MSAPKGFQKDACRVSYFENEVTVRGWRTIIVSLSRRLYIYDYIELCGYIFAYARTCALIFQSVLGFGRSCNFMTRPFVFGTCIYIYGSLSCSSCYTPRPPSRCMNQIDLCHMFCHTYWYIHHINTCIHTYIHIQIQSNTNTLVR